LNACLPRFALCAALLASGGVAARSNLDFDSLTGGSYPSWSIFRPMHRRRAPVRPPTISKAS